jgi:hypothetical protein
MAEKFTTFPDIPINIEPVTQEQYNIIVNSGMISPNYWYQWYLWQQTAIFPEPITRKQLFDIYWTKEYSYTFSLKTKYGEVNEAGTKNSYTSVQRKGQTGAYFTPTKTTPGNYWGYYFDPYYGLPLNKEDRESLGELNDSDPRKALISYVTATCQVATEDNFLAKGLCTNPFEIIKEEKEENWYDSKPITRCRAYFGFGTTSGLGAGYKKYAPVGTPFAAWNIIETDPETDEIKQTDKYYISPLTFGGEFSYQEGQFYYINQDNLVIRYWARFQAYTKPPDLDPSRPNFKKIGNLKFHDLKPVEIWGEQWGYVYEKTSYYDEFGGPYYYYELKEDLGTLSVDFTVASSSKFDFEI